jgi:hypothetical protein
MEIAMNQSGQDDFYVVPKIENYNPKRSYMQKHVKEGSCLKTQEMLSNPQMCRTGDRQPFCEALN